MRLSELKTGQRGVIIKVMGHGGFRKRIVEMGFVKGNTVEVVLNAPLRDPIKYKIMGYEISLRREEAGLIEVVSVDEALGVQPQYHGSKEEFEQLSDDEMNVLARGKRRNINVALVGNPNCGKTSLFNFISGAHERVGNYSGVTVDAIEGEFDFQGYHFHIFDLPGTYSLSAYTPEERYVRRHIIEETPDIIVNVVDSSNLERNLYLTTQLIDMNVRMVVALNMYDELEKSGAELDYDRMSHIIGVPAIPTVFRSGRGVQQLFHSVIEVYERGDYLDDNEREVDELVLKEMREWHEMYASDHEFGIDRLEKRNQARFYLRHIHINHGDLLEKCIDAVKREVASNGGIRHKYSTRFLAIKLLEHDAEAEGFVSGLPGAERIFSIRDREEGVIRDALQEDGEQAVTDAKYGFIAGVLRQTYHVGMVKSRVFTEKIDRLVTHKWLGYPVFFLILFLMFEFTFILGQYPMDWIEEGVARFGELVGSTMPEGPLRSLIVDGAIAGVGAVVVFLPNILILYFFIALMEESGYMARAAFIMDKIMHKMGLHGKSFIPLIMGFGCNVPAIMATRTIEDKKSRLVTMLVNPFFSCTARLPVFLIMAGAFFPRHAGLVLFSLYTIGILLAVLLALIFSRFLVTGDRAPFVMELPPYRAPSMKSVLSHTWDKGRQYLKKLGGIILVASIVLWALGYFPHDDGLESKDAQLENSYIGRIGHAVEPVFAPLGFDWKLDIGLISGAGAKELVVSTLGVLYTGEEAEELNPSLSERLHEGYDSLQIYSYLLFVLIYFPCIATLAAIKGESGSWKWALFTAGYTTGLAYLVCYLFYSIANLLI